MNNNNTKTILTFLLGAIAGAAIGIYLASDNKEELIADVKNAGKKMKETFDEEFEKGKKFVADLKGKISDILDE